MARCPEAQLLSLEHQLRALLDMYSDENCTTDTIAHDTVAFVHAAHTVARRLSTEEGRAEELQRCLDYCRLAVAGAGVLESEAEEEVVSRLAWLESGGKDALLARLAQCPLQSLGEDDQRWLNGLRMRTEHIRCRVQGPWMMETSPVASESGVVDASCGEMETAKHMKWIPMADGPDEDGIVYVDDTLKARPPGEDALLEASSAHGNRNPCEKSHPVLQDSASCPAEGQGLVPLATVANAGSVTVDSVPPAVGMSSFTAESHAGAGSAPDGCSVLAPSRTHTSTPEVGDCAQVVEEATVLLERKLQEMGSVWTRAGRCLAQAQKVMLPRRASPVSPLTPPKATQRDNISALLSTRQVAMDDLSEGARNDLERLREHYLVEHERISREAAEMRHRSGGMAKPTASHPASFSSVEGRPCRPSLEPTSMVNTISTTRRPSPLIRPVGSPPSSSVGTWQRPPPVTASAHGSSGASDVLPSTEAPSWSSSDAGAWRRGVHAGGGDRASLNVLLCEGMSDVRPTYSADTLHLRAMSMVINNNHGVMQSYTEPGKHNPEVGDGPRLGDGPPLPDDLGTRSHIYSTVVLTGRDGIAAARNEVPQQVAARALVSLRVNGGLGTRSDSKPNTADRAPVGPDELTTSSGLQTTLSSITAKPDALVWLSDLPSSLALCVAVVRGQRLWRARAARREYRWRQQRVEELMQRESKMDAAAVVLQCAVRRHHASRCLATLQHQRNAALEERIQIEWMRHSAGGGHQVGVKAGKGRSFRCYIAHALQGPKGTSAHEQRNLQTRSGGVTEDILVPEMSSRRAHCADTMIIATSRTKGLGPGSSNAVDGLLPGVTSGHRLYGVPSLLRHTGGALPLRRIQRHCAARVILAFYRRHKGAWAARKQAAPRVLNDSDGYVMSTIIAPPLPSPLALSPSNSYSESVAMSSSRGVETMEWWAESEIRFAALLYPVTGDVYDKYRVRCDSAREAGHYMVPLERVSLRALAALREAREEEDRRRQSALVTDLRRRQELANSRMLLQRNALVVVQRVARAYNCRRWMGIRYRRAEARCQLNHRRVELLDALAIAEGGGTDASSTFDGSPYSPRLSTGMDPMDSGAVIVTRFLQGHVANAIHSIIQRRRADLSV